MGLSQGQEESIAVHKLLKERVSASEAAEAWKEKCRQRYPYSLYFQGEKCTSASVLDSLYDEADKSKAADSSGK